jgi:endonuclease III
MGEPSRQEVVEALLRLHGRTFVEEAGFSLTGGGPSELFRLLVAALLFSARIRSSVAVAAARALAAQGWTSVEKLAASSWRERTTTLNQSGYARYDERTSTMLGDTAQLALERYGGDLRRLRDDAGRDASRERELLKQFKGIGDVGADIFLREVQAVWDEVYPFADERALSAARELGLGGDPGALAELVDRDDFPRLVASLVRLQQSGEYDEIRRAAGGRGGGRGRVGHGRPGAA